MDDDKRSLAVQIEEAVDEYFNSGNPEPVARLAVAGLRKCFEDHYGVYDDEKFIAWCRRVTDKPPGGPPHPSLNAENN